MEEVHEGVDRHVKYLVIGAGVTGLSFANFIDAQDWLILEAADSVGGYCKTVAQDGFVWDYSGHFFHFRRPDVEAFLVERMAEDQDILKVKKEARILYKKSLIDFPFQKNIHQLPHDEFVDCVHDLILRDQDAPQENFAQMLVARFGSSIAEKFLIPYNTKLYACDLDSLDHDAMGRFFPHANLEEIVRNWRTPDNGSYNASFTYPSGGAIQYIHALCHDLDMSQISLSEGAVEVDLERKRVRTTKGRWIGFDTLVSSVPLDRFVPMCNLPAPPQGTLTSNKVVVFNLGFDRKGWDVPHWVYIPEEEYIFYRVGFYDNIFGHDRMSLYVEIGRPTDADVDIDALRDATLRDLRKAGIVTDHQLVSSHTVTLDPAYVHIRQSARDFTERTRQQLQTRNVYSLGRYGGWTYCSIEDNMVEARDLALLLNSVPGA